MDDKEQEIQPKEELKTKSTFGLGVGAAIIGSLCCTVPLLAIFVGFGSASILFSFSQYRPYFLALSFVLLAVALWWNWRRNKKCCQTKQAKERLLNITYTIAILYVLILGFLTYGVPKIVASYQASNKKQQVSSKQISKNQELKTSSNQISKNDVRLNVAIEGMTCPSCATGLNQIMMNKKGVTDASISYSSGKGYVLYDKRVINKEGVLKTLKVTGYKIKLVSEKTNAK
ncbi:MAG TPA: hypothetical protein ENH57_04645 [Actinobacteria bacterium]|nr:hypothetical protein [Actinomycetota bacterium]